MLRRGQNSGAGEGARLCPLRDLLDVAQVGAVLQKCFQPFESHIPYYLQFKVMPVRGTRHAKNRRGGWRKGGRRVEGEVLVGQR